MITTAAVPRRRWMIGLLLGGGVLINYIDRVNLSVAAPQLARAFHLSPVAIGFLFSTFFWSYALMQIPVGLVLDRLGVARVGRWGALLWSMSSALVAASTGFGGIAAARLLLGVAEAPAFPANAKAIGYWFPRHERSLATSLFDAAAKFSSVIGVPLVALVMVRLGWRWGFGATALLSLAYFFAFYWLYRDPSADRHLSARERDYILAGGAAPEAIPHVRPGALLAHLLRQPKVWGLAIGFASYGYSFYLFLTWMPAYLVRGMHMNLLQSAGYATIPWIAATLSDLLVGGWLVDALIARGANETSVRKIVLITGMACGLAVLGAAFTHDPRAAIAWIALALAGLAAAAPVGWSIPALIAPPGGTATIAGIMNLGNNLMGALAPLVTGLVVAATGSFVAAFAVAGVVLMIGIFAYLVLLGRIEAIPGEV